MSKNLWEKLSLGLPVLVVNTDHPSPSLVEHLGRQPIDAIFIDCEHGSADVETVENMVRAAKVVGTSAIVRVFSHEDWVVERYLGRGADGIVVPRIETVGEAEQVASAVRDHFYPDEVSDKVVVAQIETKCAFEELPDLLQVEGIHVYFLGPIDVAKSMGHEGNQNHPEVQKALDDAIDEIRKADKISGILVNNSNVGSYANRGVQFLYAHVDELISIGTSEFCKSLQAK